MSNVYEEVDIAQRWEPTPRFIEVMRFFLLPDKLQKLLQRRTRSANTKVRNRKKLLVSTILPAFSVHAGIPLLPKQKAIVAKLKARKVASGRRDYHTVHFIEGMGYKYLQTVQPQVSICEARAHHYMHYQKKVPPHLDYPELNVEKINASDLDFEYANADKILVYSEASKRSFEQNGVPSHKILVCPLPLKTFPPRPNQARKPHQFAFVGRSDPAKGLDLAVATVKQLGPPYTLTIAGPLSQAVQTWLKQYDFVEYLGILTASELRDLYSSSKVYLAPSQESFGLAAAEAAYYGCHLVCSDWVGIAEYLPSSCVSIVPGRNEKAWALEAKRAISKEGDPNYDLVDAAFQYLSTDAVAKKLETIYRSLTR
ncbi:N-acetyl-alpha-D-glucosaminyl L-malate synthase BshA [Kocuria rosea]|uniref:glycosyltransferase n=1 Tax=Kocuria rosea TaxID=1275 RepID=UPI000F6ED3E4|nr:glycosyltransferase [Kocuria rosea]VEH42530.1 N-acetyl-alpha-D-glucosaminyl L-malate synthase BshA [Kocuria rosea]